MSLFDTVLYKGKTYQTKNLECSLNTYEISSSGRLVEIVRAFRLVPRNRQRNFGGARFPITEHFGKPKRIYTNYHGSIKFYDERERTWRNSPTENW